VPSLAQVPSHSPWSHCCSFHSHYCGADHCAVRRPHGPLGQSAYGTGYHGCYRVESAAVGCCADLYDSCFLTDLLLLPERLRIELILDHSWVDFRRAPVAYFLMRISHLLTLLQKL